MQVYDMIMLVVLVSAALFGAWKGMAWQLASVTSILLSYIVAVQFRDQVAVHIDAPEPWNRFLAMLLLYAGTSLAVWVAFRMIAGTIEKAKLKSFDSQMGALVGVGKGVLLCVVITLFAVRLLGESERTVIINSNSGYYIAQLLHRSKAILPEEISRVIDPYVHNLDERLDDEPPIGELPKFPGVPTSGKSGSEGSGNSPGLPSLGGLERWLPQAANRVVEEGVGQGAESDRGTAGRGSNWLPTSPMPSENFTPLPRNAPADPQAGRGNPQAGRESAGWR